MCGRRQEERKEAEIEIARLNAEMEEEAKKDNATWRVSPEWTALRKQELKAARKHAAKRAGAPKKKMRQIWRGKKFRVEKFKRGVNA